jgi:deoxyribodipyrimidine photo-lyase
MNQRIFRHQEARQDSGNYVLYWMQQAQRIHYNPAFDFAAAAAKSMNSALVVCFVLSPEVPDAFRRHYRFMIEGLSEISSELAKQNIPFYLLLGNPVELIPEIASSARLLVLDHGYLNWQKAWRDRIFPAEKLRDTEIVELDTEATIPVHLVSDKEEYSAATLRRKIIRLLPDWQSQEPAHVQKLSHKELDLKGVPHYPHDVWDLDKLWAWAVAELSLTDGPDCVNSLIGGYSQARQKLATFCKDRLPSYSQFRNHPDKDFQSELSPYLHFGQISTDQIMHEILDYWQVPKAALPHLISDKKSLDGMSLNIADFAEELIVRRELSMNFCHYNPDYDSPACLPAWARKSLNDHLMDPREKDYPLDILEQGETDDQFWNAAQKEMLFTGKMHNYMRMYWGKRLLMWCPSVDDAYAILLYLNNKYEMDGRDANAYAGVAWCFGKHDRPWAERPIYGMVRYMNDNGLKRKFDMKAYLKKVASGSRDEVLA